MPAPGAASVRISDKTNSTRSCSFNPQRFLLNFLKLQV